MSLHVSSISDGDFESGVINSELPVLIDFWAEWCGPCRMLAPVLDDVAKEYADRVRFVKLNVDENTATPAKYGIRSIPTLLLFKNGNVEATITGALSRAQMKSFLDENL